MTIPMAEFIWPSDLDRAENDELNRVCEHLKEVMDEYDAALEREQALNEMFQELRKIFGIGESVTSTGVVLSNARNSSHFSNLLHAVELNFFMVQGEPDEDYPDDEPDDECLVNCWASTKEEYVDQFRKALNHRDLIKQAEALEEFAESLPKFGHIGVEKALLLKSRALLRQAEDCLAATGECE